MIQLMLITLALGADAGPVKIGAKSFSESVILQNAVGQLAETKGAKVKVVSPYAGTRQCWDAMLNGELDAYPDYTGTIAEEILKNPALDTVEQLRTELAKQGIRISGPLGFHNTYAIGMRKDLATELNITSISDLTKHPQLRMGFGNEFMERSDGWRTLRNRYQLPHEDVTGIDHTLAYISIAEGDLDLMDVYSTDPNIERYGMVVLNDDLRHFPNYEAVFLYRDDLVQTSPEFVEAVAQLEGKIDAAKMRKLNELVDVQRQPEGSVARDFLQSELSIESGYVESSRTQQILKYTKQHLFLVLTSLALAIVIAIPLGVVAAKKPLLGQFILGAAEIIQTIPGLALLVLLMDPVRALGFNGASAAPVIIALVLYSLLPIIRNTYTGMMDIPSSVRESAESLGLTKWAQLTQIELPLASRMILAGIKTTAVINVGYATLGGLIGSGGYGVPIMAGLRNNSSELMLMGAVPAAVLALVVKIGFEISERFLVPEGLKQASK
ncbi:MAG: osmoprotectant transport system permease protein [Pirellulaceae bacterium]|jgi:osmoprotectant transport system permease protein